LDELNKKKLEEWNQKNTVDCNFNAKEEQKSNKDEKEQADSEVKVISESKTDTNLIDDREPKNEEVQEKGKGSKGPKIDNDVQLKI
jgi:hypothetical protein